MIELRAIGKTFPGVRALNGVTLAIGVPAEKSGETIGVPAEKSGETIDAPAEKSGETIAPGEVLGLVGENGAGKSTLIKILGGVYEAGSFTGSVVIDGKVQAFRSTLDARRAGVAIVHQELALVPEMSIAENLMLGREPARFGLVDRAELEAKARALLAPVLGAEAEALDFQAPVAELGVGVQQCLEIARALADRAKVVVLDEPTAALSEAESEKLFALIRERRASGDSFIYISHRLEEIAMLCDRVAVLRDGELVDIVTPETDLVPLMTGAAIHDQKRTSTSTSTSTILRVAHLRVAHPALPGRFVVDGLSFDVKAGEVVALAGAMGAGRTATLATLFGTAKAGYTGTVAIDGKAVVLSNPRAAIAAGFAYVPEDRKAMGLVLGLSVADNLALSALGKLSKLGIVDHASVEHSALSRLRELSIKAPSLGAEVATLSGGNQQKVVIGKWLELAPRVLLLDEPTRGVDVGAKAEIYALVEELTSRGHAVVVASSDLPEVVRLADRVIVLREGKPAGELTGADITPIHIMQLAVGTIAAVMAQEALGAART